MDSIFNEERQEWMTPRDYFVVYGPDITQWPKLTCPGSKHTPSGEHTLAVHNFRALGIQLAARNNAGEHRIPPRAEVSFDHRPGEAKDCPRRFRDKGQFDDLSKDTVDHAAGKKVRMEFFLPHNIYRTVKILQKILGDNYSNKVLEELVAIMDEKNMWSGNFQPWYAPYLLLQQKEFSFRFKNGHIKQIRFLADKDREALRMVYAGTSREVRGRGNGPFPMNEMAAARLVLIARHEGEQTSFNFGVG